LAELLFPSYSQARMQALASGLAAKLQPGDILTLKGEVGAGKTSFAQSLIGAIAQHSPEVTSPTFTLMQSYDVLIGGRKELLWHLDLYRLEHIQEAESLGLEELWPHITLIEWPGIIAPLLPEGHLSIEFDFALSGDARDIKITGNKLWQNRLQSIESGI
jgi:tRNA threonylcarbamoyl adenosine modification protein YjeE